jgi:hypothetical protein
MYCPNCGNKNAEDQNFCRSCGLGLEKIAQSLTEQLPTVAVKSLQERKERLERLGVALLSVFGLGFFGFLLYNIFFKLLLTQGALVASLAVLGAIIFIGSGLVSVILFAKAKELKEATGKRQIEPVTIELWNDTNNRRSASPIVPRTSYRSTNESANGARYDIQGQARSASPLVTWTTRHRGLKGRNTAHAISPFQGTIGSSLLTWGDALRFASRLPLAVIFRAVGAFLRAVGASGLQSYLRDVDAVLALVGDEEFVGQGVESQAFDLRRASTGRRNDATHR